MDAFAIVLALVRGLHVAVLAGLFGTLVSLGFVAPAGLRATGTAVTGSAHRRLMGLARWSAGLALLLGIAWLLLETATMAGVFTMQALRTVVTATQFGHVLGLRLVLLLLTLPLLAPAGWRLTVAILIAGAALALQGGLSHAGAVGGSAGAIMLGSEALHVLAAGAWLGGLPPLLLLIRGLPPLAAAEACEQFSPVGLGAVLAIACTAVIQARELIGGVPGLFGTAYGHIALVKLGLFAALLLLAVANRFVLTGWLRRQPRPSAKPALLASIAVETMLGLAVILVAAFLASSTPATHETPVWPFARQLSFDQLRDPYGRVLVFYAVFPALLGVALLVAARLARRFFWPALGVLAACLIVTVTRLEPLLSVEAYPTTFEMSPTEFAAGSIMRGARLFAANCTACHGTGARGDGPLAKNLPLPPADLTAPHFWAHSEGDLYWFITHGIDAAPGVPAMPPFGNTLSSGNVWALIDFLKANNAGYSLRTTGRWDHPIPLPQFDAVCADGSAIDDDDLRGRVVHIIAGTQSVMPPPTPAGVGLTTIVLAHAPAPKPLDKACVTVAPNVWDAFALLLGTTPDNLSGTQIMADANLWLRLHWRKGDPAKWNNSQDFAAAVRDIAAHPLPADSGGAHAHHH